MALSGGEYLVTGTATDIATALGITDTGVVYCQAVQLRNNPAAANDAYFGGATVTTTANRMGVLRATDTYSTILKGNGGAPLDIRKIFLIGTANAANIIFIALVR